MSKSSLGYLVLCDGHVKTSGKDCIIGIFNRIFAKSFPTQHEQCYLAFELWADPGKHELMVQIRDTDGGDVVDPLGPLEMFVADSGQGTGAIHLRGLPLQRAGIYTFVVILDGKELGGRDLFVEPMPRN